MKHQTKYISVDIETDGPIPWPYSMISLGACVLTLEDGILDTFEVNIKPLEGGQQDPKTMDWWAGKTEAWDYAQKDQKTPEQAMSAFRHFISSSAGRKPVLIQFPDGFDFMFLYWYLITFGGQSPFSFSAFGMKTAASLILDKPYRQCSKRNFPKRWFGDTPHTHKALDDAIGQGEMFLGMMKDRKNV